MSRDNKQGNGPVSNFIWSLTELIKFKKGYLFILILNAVINGVSPVISLLLIQKIIDVIQFRLATLQDVVFLFTLLVALQLISELLLIITNVKLNNYELEFDLYFQEKILSKVSNLSCKDFENSHTYDLINRAQYDANSGILGSIKIFFTILASLISSVSYAVIILKYNYILFFVTLLIPIARYFLGKRYNLKEYALEKENTEPNRRAGYISYLLTNSENFKEIKTFGLFDFLLNRFHEIKELCNIKIINLNNRRKRTFALLTVLDKAVDLGVSIFILTETFNGAISIGSFVLYNNTIDNLQGNVVSMFSQLSILYKNSAIIDQLRCFFQLQTEVVNKDGIVINKIESIVIKDVSYKYQGKNEYALRHINLDFRPGEVSIIMGSNGSGKSTLVKIIMGIYNDYTGTILINGYDLRQVNMEKYRQRISSLFQDYIKFESSITDNIGYGEIHTPIKIDRVKETLEKVHLDDFIKCPDQVLGYQFRNGTQLSIGQWQKLALGRVLYRDADVYIFDEPNASLDLLTESSILKTIHNDTHDKITMLIMHRFNHIVNRADKIIVLEDGYITEIGTHADLVVRKGTYYNLFNAHKKIHDIEVLASGDNRHSESGEINQS